jgi:integrase
MATDSSQGYAGYKPPKEQKRHPLTRHDTKILYKEAVQHPDREVELAVRTLLDYGLRSGELVHARSHWVDKEFNRELGQKLWRIKIPKVEYCWGGKGGHEEAGNPNGENLHVTNNPCGECVDRSWKGKIAPDGKKENGWLTEQQAEEYDYSPKKPRSATKVWQFPGISDAAETAAELKEFLEGQDHKQWPHMGNAVRNRLDKVVERARPDDPTDPGPEDLRLPDRSQPKVVPHALRHTYGCRLVEMGVGEGAAMKQMRHQNADVFRWYSDVRGARVVSALNDAVSESDSLLHR